MNKSLRKVLSSNSYIGGLSLRLYRLFKYGEWRTMDKWSLEHLIKYDMDIFEKMQGYRFDIHHPITFPEKCQWSKFFCQFPERYRITDKVTFKDYIGEKLGKGHVVPMYGAWDSIEALEKAWKDPTPSILPETFILKANMQSSGQCIVTVKK